MRRRTGAVAAHTFTREDRAAATHRLNAERLATQNEPTLLLTGSESPPMFRTWIDQITALLPDSSVRTLQGEGHAATVTAPELLATEILAFAHRRPVCIPGASAGNWPATQIDEPVRDHHVAEYRAPIRGLEAAVA